jgi:hypothetical protein
LNSSEGATADQARRELDALEALSERAAIKLYSLLEDYLEQLRQELPHQLLQAVFHLCTRLQPEAFNAMAEGQRHVMRERMLHLSQRCSSLLTVEQLAQLGSRLMAADEMADPEGEEGVEPEISGELSASASDSEPEAGLQFSLESPSLLGNFDPSQFCSTLSPEPEELNPPEEPASSLDQEQALSFLRQMARGSVLGSSLSAMEREASPFPLPREPQLLRLWLGVWDQALQRRLRNLSHAINVELLRSGLCQNLMPLTLLDAALGGQVDQQGAAANLLTVRLPMPEALTSNELQLHGLLIRVTELEHALPHLRDLRNALHKLDGNLRKMERRIQHWQQRLAVLHAQQLWSQDNTPTVQPQV